MSLTANAPVQQPCVLPCVQAQDRLNVDTARGKLSRGLPPLGLHLVPVIVARTAILAYGVHVATLPPPVGTGVGASSEIGGEDLVLVGARLDQPDEAGAEHGRGGDNELAAEGLDGGKVELEVVTEGGGHGFAAGADALEEEVVVVGHGGVVEDGSLRRLTSGHDGDRLCVLVLELRTCGINVLVPATQLPACLR